MIPARGLDTVRVTKVEGHATDADVDSGRVGLEDKHGNAEADEAADLVGYISLNFSLVLGVLCLMLVVIGFP